MNKLALKDEILLSIDKPARYIGNEINIIKKDKNTVDIRFAMCFPDVYEIGMSHLGIQIIYEMLNRREDIYCERVYSPWTDLDKIMRDQKIPLFALESQDPVKEFDFLGITLQYEMCYTNVLQILDLSQIPIFSSERCEDDPIVIGGGPCTYNPEPLVDFFDIFYIGEGETVFYDLMDLYKSNKKAGKSRNEFLKQASKIPGIYVPSLYDVFYNEDGTINKYVPKYSDIPEKITKQVVADMSDTYYPVKPLVPYIQVTQDRVVLEIQRGCIRGCRFCQAGIVYRPVRERSLEELKELAEKLIKNTGQDEISLTSLSSSDFSKLSELVDFLISEFHGKGVNVSLPSLRIDSFSLDVMSKVQDVRKSSLTFAPEAGTQRLRDVINKGLSEDAILSGATLAFKGGWNKVKLYFMLGLPTETEEDREGIALLCEKIAQAYYDTIPREERIGKKAQISASSSFFIPKPFTPFQWSGMYSYEEYMEMAKNVNIKIKNLLNKKSIRYNWHDAKTSVIEGLLARGDRKLGQVIYSAYKKGCIYDAWTEYFNYEKWVDACTENNIDINFYALRQRDISEVLPWDIIDTGVTKDFLINEYNNALNQTVTPNCREKCTTCGATSFKTGICLEKKEA